MVIQNNMNRDEEYQYLLLQRKYLWKILAFVEDKLSGIEHEILKEAQEKCEHDFKYNGHGHNYDCYTCKKCTLDKYV